MLLSRFKSNSKTLRSVLTLSATVLLVSQTLMADTKNGTGLKTSERPGLSTAAVESFIHASVYESLIQYVLTAETPEQRRLALAKLSGDTSVRGLRAFAEIASISSDSAIRNAALQQLIESGAVANNALQTVLLTSRNDSVRDVAAKALARIGDPLTPRNNEGDLSVNALTDLEKSFALKILNTPSINEIENGSRYLIQSWFLKKLLALQTAPMDSRIAQFNFLINEISIYLNQPAETVSIQTPADLDKFKTSLSSRFVFLKDEMRFSHGLSGLKPVRLNVAAPMRAAVNELSAAFRELDRPIKELQGRQLFDLLSDASPIGSVFRLKLKTLKNEEKATHLSQIAGEFAAQANALQNVAPKLIEQKVIQFKMPAEQRFFELLISHYFSTYSFEESANVMKAMIERPDLKSGPELFHMMVMYAGPQMQKLLQVVGRRPGISKELSLTFQRLEESGLASPWERVGSNFKTAPLGTEWISLDRSARVGSMAEVYKGLAKTPQGSQIKIASRTLKSDIRERVEREIPRLVELGRVIDSDPLLRSYDFPLVGPVMEDVMSMARNELDIKSTIRSQEMGERIYTTTKKISKNVTVHFVTPHTFSAAHGDVIYSTWLNGEKFEDFVSRHPTLGLQVAEATAQHWLENALFNERFFHADLHQGNLKIIENSPGDLTVGLLDFGMVGQLQKRERSILIRLSLATVDAATSVKKTALISKYLYELSEKSQNRTTLEELTLSAEKYARANAATPALLTMDMWLGWGLSRGLKLPKNITAFSRGIGAVEQLTLASGSKTYIADMVKQVAMKHKLELAPDLLRFANDSVRSSIDDVMKRLRFASEPKPGVALNPVKRINMRCEAIFN